MATGTSMQRNPSATKRRGFSTREIKALIVALALFLALGFWGVFSKQLITDAALTAAGLNSPSSTYPAPQPTQEMVINFPPLPALVPYKGLQKDGQSGDPTPAGAVSAPQTAATDATSNLITGKILLGGAAPQPITVSGGSGSSGHGAVTRTRSSHP